MYDGTLQVKAMNQTFKHSRFIFHVASILILLNSNKNIAKAASTTSTSHDDAIVLPLRNSSDPSVGIFPIDCYSCKAKYPDYSFCNNNNQFGACCPEKSTDLSCMTDSSHNIYCSEDESNHDFYYSKCLLSSDYQCGSAPSIQTFHGEDETFTTETSGLKRAGGQSCSWQIQSQISKAQYYQVEIQIQFQNITNMDVYVLSGYKKSTAYTVDYLVLQNETISVPIYNTTWVVAVPKTNSTANRIKFKSYIFREVPTESEDMNVRRIITITVIVAGLAIFLFTMGGILVYRRIKERTLLKRGKMSIAPQRDSHIQKSNKDHTILNQEDEQQEDVSIADFEELILFKSKESPIEDAKKGGVKKAMKF
eukprot:403355158